MRWIAPAGVDAAVLARAASVRLAVFDVDGVLTDGALHYGPHGEEVKVFNTLDGHGLKMLRDSGVEIAIISGRSSDALARRAADFKITQLFMGVADKRVVFDQLIASLELQSGDVAGIGDDVVDLPYLTRCGLAVCVPSAPRYMHAQVHYGTEASGGRGAVREFCEIIMHARGTLESALARYLD